MNNKNTKNEQIIIIRYEIAQLWEIVEQAVSERNLRWAKNTLRSIEIKESEIKELLI